MTKDKNEFIIVSKSGVKKSVYDFLISKGISKNRMTYIGLGVTSPLYSIPEKNVMEENANRRVEIKIISN